MAKKRYKPKIYLQSLFIFSLEIDLYYDFLIVESSCRGCLGTQPWQKLNLNERRIK